MTQIKMPEPYLYMCKDGSWVRTSTMRPNADSYDAGTLVELYTAEQLKQAMRDVLEQAAKHIDDGVSNVRKTCADEIREMKDQIQ